MRTWWTVAYGVVVGLLGAGVLYLVASPPRGEPIDLAPAPTQAPLRVHVTGGVASPGVHALPLGSRVEDAIQAAGGLLPSALAGSVNLAAPIQDGGQVDIPQQSPAPAAGNPQPALSPVAASPTDRTAVDINTATQAELESLPGIGPATARKIIAYRQEHGPFPSIDDLRRISGIGPATFDGLKDLISTGDLP